MPMIASMPNARPMCTSGNPVELPAGFMHKSRPGYISQHQFLQDISQSQHSRKPFSEFTPADLACLTNQQAAQLATQLSIAQMTNAPPHIVNQLNAGVNVEALRYFSNFSTCVLLATKLIIMMISERNVKPPVRFLMKFEIFSSEFTLIYTAILLGRHSVDT